VDSQELQAKVEEFGLLFYSVEDLDTRILECLLVRANAVAEEHHPVDPQPLHQKEEVLT
jgi:hypothetical protein